jgi:hypothetical protein
MKELDEFTPLNLYMRTVFLREAIHEQASHIYHIVKLPFPYLFVEDPQPRLCSNRG